MNTLPSNFPALFPLEYCTENEQVFNYTQHEGVDITDVQGNDVSGILKGSPQGYVTFAPSPTTTIEIEEIQPGTNTLMAIEPFAVINAKKVKVTIEGPDGDIYITNVSGGLVVLEQLTY